ncbi:MAG: hypothetical protein Q7U76_09015 [Nitrospirota bacterium]|nr:hypothetical protein [Nitrospirota bacterium]
MSDAQRVQKAVFTPQSGPQQGQAITVHFNPTSLQLSIANTLGASGESGDTKQYVTGSSSTLTMELTFDTTDVGTDVRMATQRIALLMEPDEQRIPAIVRFEWGTFVFQGMVQSYQETIDFFAPSGVPLRAKVNMSMARQEVVFAEDGAGSGAGGGEGAVLSLSASAGVTGISAMAGVGDVGRALGAANGLETLRFTSGPISLDASISLGGPVAFASGGMGIGVGLSGGIGIGGGAGVGIGVSGGVGAGVGVSIGGSASAGVSASQGAFAGLRMTPSGGSLPPALNPQSLFPRSDSVGLATDQGAQFGVGGRAKMEGSASLSADVGVNASLASKIRFDER